MLVTEGTGAVEPARQLASSPRDLLIEWANQQDAWVRAIVGEVIATRRELSPSALAIARDRYLVEKALAEGEATPVAALGESENGTDRPESLSLIALRHCRGVNALAEDQDMTLHPRLTVFFGENAVGKTGYVRVLKQLANVRSAEPIIPDIHRPSAAGPPQATVRYRLGETEQELEWQGDSGMAPFTRMTVFDSPAVALHLDGSMTYVFTPADLALFPYTHAAIESVRRLLDEARAAREPRGNPFLTAFARGTPVYAEIEALSASTSVARIEELAALTETERAEMEALRPSIETLAASGAASGTEAMRSRLMALGHLLTVASAVAGFDDAAYAEAADTHRRALEAQAHAADAVHSTDQLAPEVRPSWQAFVEAGENYLVASGRADYPHGDDECIYCRQELSEAATRLLAAYRDYASGSGAAAVKDARDRLAGLVAGLASPTMGGAIDALGTLLPSFEGGAAEAWLTDARALVGHAILLRRAVLAEEPAPVPANPGSATRLLAELTAATNDTEATLRALEGDAAERARLLEERRARLDALEARATVARLMPEIRGHVDAAAWSHRLHTLLARFPALLRSLTETSKVASQEILNRDFERVFYEECRRLRAPNVTLDFPGRRGEAARRKSVAPDHTLAAILSQGEQKVIAIADFLAEAALRPGRAPVIFDDPVDSFDHRRVAEIAQRIVELSEDQQVIVFTHDIMFAANLLSHFEGRAADCAYYQVTEVDGRKGIVSHGTHARLDSLGSIRGRINAAIQEAGAANDGDRQSMIDATYDHIRAWCEVVVETKLLARVTQRYQPNVAMQNLELLKPDRLAAAISVIYPIWEKSNRYIPGHSQPLQTLGIRPTVDELREDWAALQQAVIEYDAT